MKILHSLVSLSLLAAVQAATKVLICSDSTTANYDPTTTNLQGYPSSLPLLVTELLTCTSWGYYIGNYLSISVSNLARNGRSTRSFINEGLWASLLASTNAGDYVIIEMGHNDDGDPTTDTADRATLPGIGNDSVVVITSTGASETVHSFGWYLRKMIVDVRAKGATPVLSGMVPRNYWTGSTLQSVWPFAVYAHEVGCSFCGSSAAKREVERYANGNFRSRYRRQPSHTWIIRSTQ
jgi:rhamnogalacturonan acetylesterase